MSDDIVTRLRNMTILNEGVIDTTINEAADEIERLRGLAKSIYEETKRCGSKHDVAATMAWEEYEMDVLYDR